MLNTTLLLPAAILVIWSLIILFWMALTRFPAMAKLRIKASGSVGARGQDVDGLVPPNVAWKSHNYSHLMEQPTLFYAVIFILTLVDEVTLYTVSLSWAYVVLRVAHSLWQVLINTIKLRLLLFLLSTFCLVILAVIAAIAVI